MWWLEPGAGANTLAAHFYPSLAERPGLAASRTWATQQSDVVQIPTEPEQLTLTLAAS